MKRTVENPDGIYPREVHTAENREDVEAICAMWQAATPSVAKIIDGMEKHARAVLDSKPAAIMQADAICVITQCKALRQSIADGSIEAVAHHGIALGQRCAELFARRHEPKVIQATRSRKGLGKGREKKAALVDASRRTIRAAVKARMKAHPKDSLTYARQVVADEMDVAFNTVKTASAGLKMPRKKMK